ncbi:hypothetical protein [Falsiporphyromonas endometrii]|uniref:Uncharacterized protein n=1 Tax=Falsiporphyromonas endometrii TaxID=1387297 RepID=A0ABV9K4V8_9PORP
MEITILLIILLTAILLGGLSHQADRIGSMCSDQIVIPTIINNNYPTLLKLRTVKFEERGFYLLNIITLHNTQKGALTTPIYTEILTFWG